MNKKYLLFFLAFLLIPYAFAQVKIQLGKPYINIKDFSGIGFEVHPDYYEICSLDKTVIPVLIKNENKFSDVFTFSLDKGYASLPVKSAFLESGRSAILPVTLTPPFGLEENGTFMLDVMTKNEGLRRTVIIKTNIQNCYLFSVEFDLDKAELCGCDKETYELFIENSGKFSDTFAVSLDAPSWVNTTLVNNTIKLNSGQQSSIRLDASPPCETKGDYLIDAKAVSDKTELVFEDKLELNVATQKDCYYTIIDADNVDLDYFGKNTEIKVENKGNKDSTYSLSVEGIDWYELSHTNFSLKRGEEKTINLALIPGQGIVEGDYSLNIIAKADGQEFSRSVTAKLKKKGVAFEKLKFYLNYFKYYILVGFVFVIILIIALIWTRRLIQVSGVRKKEKKEKAKKVEERAKKVEERAKKVEERAKKVEERAKKVEFKEAKKVVEPKEPKSMRFILHWALYLILVAALIFLGFLTYKYKERFEAFWNVVLEFFSGFKSYAPYLKYLVIGFALLIIVILAIDYFRKKPKAKARKPAKAIKRENAKKAEKSAKKIEKKMGLFGYLYIILVGVLLLAIIGYAIYQFFGKSLGVFDGLLVFFKTYYAYFAAGIVALIVFIIVLRLLKKRKKRAKRNFKVIKNILIIIFGLIILSGIVYSFAYYNLAAYLKDFIIIYYPYILMGIGILVILILILHFHNKKIS